VIKKPLSSRQKKAEISADPNKAPAEDPIKIKTSEQVISQKSSNILNSYSFNDDQRSHERSHYPYYNSADWIGERKPEYPYLAEYLMPIGGGPRKIISPQSTPNKVP
jgi:hypothetical protein